MISVPPTALTFLHMNALRMMLDHEVAWFWVMVEAKWHPMMGWEIFSVSFPTHPQTTKKWGRKNRVTFWDMPYIVMWKAGIRQPIFSEVLAVYTLHFNFMACQIPLRKYLLSWLILHLVNGWEGKQSLFYSQRRSLKNSWRSCSNSTHSWERLHLPHLDRLLDLMVALDCAGSQFKIESKHPIIKLQGEKLQGGQRLTCEISLQGVSYQNRNWKASFQGASLCVCGCRLSITVISI